MKRRLWEILALLIGAQIHCFAQGGITAAANYRSGNGHQKAVTTSLSIPQATITSKLIIQVLLSKGFRADSFASKKLDEQTINNLLQTLKKENSRWLEEPIVLAALYIQLINAGYKEIYPQALDFSKRWPGLPDSHAILTALILKDYKDSYDHALQEVIGILKELKVDQTETLHNHTKKCIRSITMLHFLIENGHVPALNTAIDCALQNINKYPDMGIQLGSLMLLDQAARWVQEDTNKVHAQCLQIALEICDKEKTHDDELIDQAFALNLLRTLVEKFFEPALEPARTLAYKTLNHSYEKVRTAAAGLLIRLDRPKAMPCINTFNIPAQSHGKSSSAPQSTAH